MEAEAGRTVGTAGLAEQSRTKRWILCGRQNGGRLRAGRWVMPASDTSNLTGRWSNVKEFS
jgi:hypothetical protein